MSVPELKHILIVEDDPNDVNLSLQVLPKIISLIVS